MNHGIIPFMQIRNFAAVISIVLLSACMAEPPPRPQGITPPKPRHEPGQPSADTRIFRTRVETAENTPITMREEDALRPAPQPVPKPSPQPEQPPPAPEAPSPSEENRRAIERQQIIEISKAEQKRRAFVPSALAATPAGQIEVVSAKEVKEYEDVLVYSEAKAAPEPIQTHKVVQGDTLYSIALKYDVRVYNLAEVNKLSPPFTLTVGQELKISNDPSVTSTKAKPAPAPEAKVVAERFVSGNTFLREGTNEAIIVTRGDTVFSIAKANNVPLRDFILLNELSPPYNIAVGQRLFLPATAFHIVKKQDTLYSISRAYGVNMHSLAKFNNITDASKLKVGQKLVLPAAATPEDITRRKFVVPVEDGGSKVIDTVRKTPIATDTASAAPTPAPQPLPPRQSKPTPVVPAVPVAEVAIEPEAAKLIEAPAAMTGKKFSWPVRGRIISEFGAKSGGNRNDGINIQAPVGTPVLAAQNGIVAYAGNELKGLGNLIIIRHASDFITIYAHNDKLFVEKDAKVLMGDKIATVGRSGRVTSPQLHFQIRQRVNAINPTTMLQ